MLQIEEEKKETNCMTVKEKMIHLMDSVIKVVDRIAEDENAGPEKLTLIPALVESVVNITGYAAIEGKN